MTRKKTKNRIKESAIRVSDLVGKLKALAPFDYAEDWDNVGLLCGDPAARVTGVVVSVNLGQESLAEASAARANVIVCHHPPIFRPISKITSASNPFLYMAIRRGISVVALHTNFDLASKQLNQRLCEDLGGAYLEPLAVRSSPGSPPSSRMGKFVTFVPEASLEKVRMALGDAGAGYIGNYSHCTFASPGIGTFWGRENTNPAVGKAGRLERAPEMRLETIFPWRLRDKVVKAARSAHPYEEMAYDVYEVLLPVEGGYGFVARVPKSTSFVFQKLTQRVKKLFRIKDTVVVGPGLDDKNYKVRKFAFSPGSGSSFVAAAIAKGVDTYICGEVGYHQMLEAKRAGLTLILLGHSYSERFFVETTAGWCEELVGTSKTVKKVFETVHEVR